MCELIRNPQNQKIKLLRSLSTAKGREANGAFAVEGFRFVGAIPDGWDVLFYLAAESADKA
jgi:hypothetical protein